MNKFVVGSRTALVAAGSVLLLWSINANTQVSAAADIPVAQAQELPEAEQAQVIEDTKVDQFADAYIAVQEIQAKATQQLGATTDAQKASQLKQDAETQMIKAVERTGLALEEFNQIVQAMANDVALRARVSDRIGERKRTS